MVDQTPDARSLAADLRRGGMPVERVAEELQRRAGAKARTAWRLAHGWTQRMVAERWAELWPDQPKKEKDISYWEQWPNKSGREPSLTALDKLARIYGCSVADLTTDIGNYRQTALPDSALPNASADSLPDGSLNEDWYTDEVRVLLQLNGDTPEALEERTVVAVRDNLEFIDTSISLPRHPDDSTTDHGLEVALLFGGSLRPIQRASESQFRYAVEPAAPLGAAGSHTYVLRTRVPPGQLMAPHYVLIPLRRCKLFRLRVRFNPTMRPQFVWTVQGVPPAAVFDPRPRSGLLVSDRFAEVDVEFDDLRLGFAYGLVWEF